jgi:hypothetical protein
MNSYNDVENQVVENQVVENQFVKRHVVENKFVEATYCRNNILQKPYIDKLICFVDILYVVCSTTWFSTLCRFLVFLQYVVHQLQNLQLDI